MKKFIYLIVFFIFVFPNYNPSLVVAKTLYEIKNLIAVIGDTNNLSSIKIHKKNGFKKIGILEKIGFKKNTWIDSIYMQKRLWKK